MPSAHLFAIANRHEPTGKTETTNEYSTSECSISTLDSPHSTTKRDTHYKTTKDKIDMLMETVFALKKQVTYLSSKMEILELENNRLKRKIYKTEPSIFATPAHSETSTTTSELPRLDCPLRRKKDRETKNYQATPQGPEKMAKTNLRITTAFNPTDSPRYTMTIPEQEFALQRFTTSALTSAERSPHPATKQFLTRLCEEKTRDFELKTITFKKEHLEREKETLKPTLGALGPHVDMSAEEIPIPIVENTNFVESVATAAVDTVSESHSPTDDSCVILDNLIKDWQSSNTEKWKPEMLEKLQLRVTLLDILYALDSRDKQEFLELIYVFNSDLKRLEQAVILFSTFGRHGLEIPLDQVNFFDESFWEEFFDKFLEIEGPTLDYKLEAIHTLMNQAEDFFEEVDDFVF